MKCKKRRKAKQSRNCTIARKRKKQFQRAHGRLRRARFYRRRRQIQEAKSRKKAVIFYRSLKHDVTCERDAAQKTATKWQVSCSTIRRWDKLDREGGWRALMERSKRPQTIHYQISFELKHLVVVIRTLLGWGERRVSAELERRGIGRISHTSLIFRTLKMRFKSHCSSRFQRNSQILRGRFCRVIGHFSPFLGVRFFIRYSRGAD